MQNINQRKENKKKSIFFQESHESPPLHFQHQSSESLQSQLLIEGGTGDSCNSTHNIHNSGQKKLPSQSGFSASEVNAQAEFSDNSSHNDLTIVQSGGSCGTDEDMMEHGANRPSGSKPRSINLECLSTNLRQGVSKKLLVSGPCKTPKPRLIQPVSPGKHTVFRSKSQKISKLKMLIKPKYESVVYRCNMRGLNQRICF